MKVVCGLGRTNYVRPPIIDPHSRVVCGKDADQIGNRGGGGGGEYGESNKQTWKRAESGIHKYILSYRF